MEISKKNSKMWSKLGPRATYGLALLEMIERNPCVFALSADLGNSSGLSRVREKYPEHYLNTGIAEQNLIGVAAGLAREGLIPFASSFAPFITHRCADQIRMNMGYMHLNVKTVGLGSGISMSILGNSHYGLDDLSFLRSIPNLVILSPCDCTELVKCVEEAAKYVGPVYIRMTGEPGMPVVYSEEFDFRIGKANILKTGEDVTIIATGSMVYTAIETANQLSEYYINATVIDMSTIKPFDMSVFETISKKCKLIVTMEEHSVVSGLGAEVARYVAANRDLPELMTIGLPDEYVKAGTYAYILEEYHLDSMHIVERIVQRMKK